MAYSILLTEKSTSTCPNKQLTNIEGINNSVTTDIILPTTTSDVLEEVSGCPGNGYLHVSKKNMIYGAMARLTMMHDIFRLQKTQSQ